ncbi:MAG TPA: GGDEF domain-containing protein [Anaeromyxobacter sp.]|nr:GGDEF domain-containing protein [Anaeromyxobacter sp.]
MPTRARATNLPLSSIVTLGVGGLLAIAALCAAIAGWTLRGTGAAQLAPVLGVLVAAGALLMFWTTRRVAEREKALRAEREDAERLALRDALTHAYNRRFLAEVLPKLAHQSARCRTPLSALMIDVDRFKRLNDRYGHPAGDRVLSAVARCLAGQIRASDTLVRYGGEEFLVLLPHTALPGALVIAERVREAVERTRTAVPQADHPLAVTISVGVATLPADGASAEDLLLAADQALFRAKGAGRNQVVAAAEAEARMLALAAGT